MEPRKINFLSLKKLYESIKKASGDAVGNYLYKGFRIQVSRYNLSTSERVSQLYHKRRSEGLCVQCARKVRKKNPRTGKPYRLCEYHREKIDRK